MKNEKFTKELNALSIRLIITQWEVQDQVRSLFFWSPACLQVAGWRYLTFPDFNNLKMV